VQRVRVRSTGPKWSGRRPKTVSEQARRQVCLIARCCRRDLGLSFITWSLSKLADYLAAIGIARISREAIRQILRGGGIRWQATKTGSAGFAAPAAGGGPCSARVLATSGDDSSGALAI
jgi:transposase